MRISLPVGDGSVKAITITRDGNGESDKIDSRAERPIPTESTERISRLVRPAAVTLSILRSVVVASSYPFLLSIRLEVYSDQSKGPREISSDSVA